jgi:hypothetical protein
MNGLSKEGEAAMRTNAATSEMGAVPGGAKGENRELTSQELEAIHGGAKPVLHALPWGLDLSFVTGAVDGQPGADALN